MDLILFTVQDLHKQYNQLGIETKDNSFARRLLKEYLLEEKSLKTTDIVTNKTKDKSSDDSTVEVLNGLTNSRSSPPILMTQLKEKAVEKKERQFVDRRKPTDDSIPLTVAEKFGLRSASKKANKDSIDSFNVSFEIMEPQVIINTQLPSVPSKGSNSKSCDVCEREWERQFPNGVLCRMCYRFYRNNIENNLNVCQLGGNCLISVNNKKNCRNCRWNRCLAVIGDSNGVANGSLDEQSVFAKVFVSNSDQINGKYKSSVFSIV